MKSLGGEWGRSEKRSGFWHGVEILVGGSIGGGGAKWRPIWKPVAKKEIQMGKKYLYDGDDQQSCRGMIRGAIADRKKAKYGGKKMKGGLWIMGRSKSSLGCGED